MADLVIVMALRCEANPLIAALGLSPSPGSRGFGIFSEGCCRPDGVRLIISGVGKVCAASAVGYLLGQGINPTAPWINLGIAGHREASVGQVFMVDAIEDRGTGRSYRLEPELKALNPPLPAVGLLTVDRPTAHYPETQLVDMEASGIAGALLGARHRPPFFCLKIVSDNAENPPPARPNPTAVRTLMASRVRVIEEVLEAVMEAHTP